MAIVNTVADTAPTTVYTSNGNTAITFMSLCNFTEFAQEVSIYIVPSGNTPGLDNIVIASLELTPKNTYEFYHGAEKLILADGDYIAVSSTDPGSVSVFVSYTGF